MSENTDYMAPPSSPQAAPRPPLRRSEQNKVLAGVASGFARWLGVDPVIVRVVLVVLAVFGGSGLLLYAIGWLFIPAESSSESEAERLLREGRRDRSLPRLVLIAIAVVLTVIVTTSVLSAIAFGPFGHWGGGGAALLIVASVLLVVYLVKRPYLGAATSAAPPQQPPVVPPAPGGTASADVTTAAYDTGAPTQDTAFAYGGSGQYPGYVATPASVPSPPRSRSYLGLATVSIAVIVSGILAAISASGAGNVPAVVVAGSALGILGLGLVVGAFFGRARWLLLLAVPLLLVTAVTAALPRDLGPRVSKGVGSHTWVPLNETALQGSYEVGVGSATLDLTSVSLPDGTNRLVTVTAGVGQVRVLVPTNMRVYVNAHVEVGRIRISDLAPFSVPAVPTVGANGKATAGPQGTEYATTLVFDRGGRHLVWALPLPNNPSTGPTVLLDLNASIGSVEVEREPASN